MPNIHDAAFALPPRPPFRWGQSPFRARGVLYRDEITFANRVLAPLGTSVQELVRRSNDPALDQFMAQRFDNLGWYDVQPILWIGQMVARARSLTLAHQSRETALAHAQTALTGFSSVLLKLASNETVAAWLPRISSGYHDFGGVETRVIGPRHVRGVRSGMPSFFVQAWAVSATSFVERILVHVGAKEPRAHTLEAEPDGARDGVALYRVAFEIRWSE
jgi:hypothetical protein